MKILITTDWYKPVINGVVTSVSNLEDGLKALGHDIRIAAVSNTNYSFKRNNVYYFASLNASNIYPGARVNISPNKEYLQELLDWAPEVIHSQCEFSSFRIATKIADDLKIPIVHTYHTVYEDYTHYFSPSERWGKQVTAVLTRLILKRVDMVIAPTRKVKDLLEGYEIKPEVFVVPTGINTDKYNKTIEPERKAMLLRELGIPEDKKVLLYLGRIATEKNLDEVIRYTAELGRDDLFLLVVGDGPARADVEAEVARLKMQDVHFTGMIPQADVSDYYQLGDVFVSASTSEAQGLTYYEALMTGLPIVCKHDPILDTIIIDGVNGYQFNDFTGYKKGLESILDTKDGLKGNKEKIAQDFKETYSIKRFAENALAVYEKAISNKNMEGKTKRSALGFTRTILRINNVG
ncbi:MAG: glycosyltransferase [Clostridiaceae bacterium]